MTRRTRVRRSLLTVASQPWTLFEEGGTGEGGTGGGGAGNQAPQLNEHGFPDATPVADMPPEQAASYWKFQSRKHETRANAAPTVEELETLRAAATELATRKASELTETQRLQAEADTAKAEAATAVAAAATSAAELLRTQVAALKGLTLDQAARLQGSTKAELEADADALKALFTTAPVVRPGTGSGSDVGAGKTVSAGEARYAAKYGTTT